MKLIGLVLAIFFLANFAYSQSPDTRKGPSTTPTISKPSTKAELEIQQRSVRARSLLVSLSTDARSFRDQTLRARSLARIADSLWQVDVDQARLLFRNAWEAAEVADQESDKKLQEEINNQKTRTGSFAITFPPNIRGEVLRLTARHDRAMAEDFLAKLISAKGDVPNSATTRRDPLSDRPDEATSQRLAVASDLLKADEIERALQFAAPALAVVKPGTIDFLSDLREKNPTSADSAYLALLNSSLNDPRSDANTVSLLASYIFTPHMFMTFSGAGASMSQRDSTVIPATVTPELKATFFQSAATVLLRPLPSADQLDQSSLGIDGKYLVIKRLLTFFEQSASAELVEGLRGHLNALDANVSNNARRREDDWMSRGIKPDKPPAEREQEILDRIERVKTSAERDVLYLQLAFMLSMQGDVRARDITAKVENPETRKQAQAFVDSSLANYFVAKKLSDAALDLVHKGDLTRPHKSWILAQCAKMFATTDTTKALELIDEATDEARRIDPSDPALPRALLAVANALKLVDSTRLWDAAFNAVKAANSAEGFTGEDGQFIFRFQSRAQNSISNKRVPDFDLEPLFRDLTMLDYDRSVELARGFQAEGPRAIATIAIARAVLSPKNTAAPR